MSGHDDLVAQFQDITGVDEERAKFYLESSAWQINVALASFYENDAPLDETNDPSEEVEEVAAPPTRRDLNQRIAAAEMDVSSSDSEDEEGQAFYVGGSERSGQQVIGPARKKGKDIVAEMFKSAREHGAEVVEKSGPGSRASVSFQGTGYRLGESENDTRVVPGASAPVQPRSVTLKLWKTGFSVDEGALREYQDPVNRDFLESIKRGEVPMELIRESRGREVHLQMEDHRTEDFAPPKQKFQAFKGTGQMLGSPAPSVVTASVTPQASSSSDNAANEEMAKQQLNFDSSQPSTNVQIRLADGSRLIGQFNHTHTVGDLRNYVIHARPQYAKQNFDLLTSYPSRPLNDNSVSLKDASLLNATIMQRMK